MRRRLRYSLKILVIRYVLALLRSCRANIVAISVTTTVFAPGTLIRSLHAKLAYVTPSHQYPTGALLTLARRVELSEWARRRSAWIVEDDYDSEFNYSGRAHPTLQGLKTIISASSTLAVSVKSSRLRCASAISSLRNAFVRFCSGR